MAQTPETPLFSVLPERRPPWKQFGFTMVAESLGVLFVAWFGVLHPDVLTVPTHDYHFIRLVETPAPVNHQPQPVPLLKPVEIAKYEPSPDALRVPPDLKPKPAHEDAPAAPKIGVAPRPAELPQATARIPRQPVQTNVFSMGSSEPATIERAPQQVQTGGFGDPNGTPAHPANGRPVTIAQMGSFDLPSGPGYGNGTGGQNGVRGVVASAGFGNGAATSDGARTSPRGSVRESGFGDTEPVAKTEMRPKPGPSTPRLTPAEIVEKPAPAYTEEAKKLRVQGEVLLEVVFGSTGKLRVLRVVRGLGHGLDESAIQAAERIRFKPALRDGQPADSTAVLHIIFQLA